MPLTDAACRTDSLQERDENMGVNMAYEEGEAAYNRGESHGDNPYPVGTLKHFDWDTAIGEGATERRMKDRDRLVKQLRQE